MKSKNLLGLVLAVALALTMVIFSSPATAASPQFDQRECKVYIKGQITLTREHPMRLQTWRVNEDCTIEKGPVMDLTAEQLASLELIGEPNPKYETRIFRLPDPEPHAAAGILATNSTCHGFQRMVDVVGLRLTQIEAVISWSWNGSNVLSTWNRYVVASWFPDGWHVTDGPHAWLYGPTLPAQYQHFAGWGSFAWLFETYPHTHYVRDTVWYNGSCSITGDFSGSIVPGGSVYYGGWVTTP